MAKKAKREYICLQSSAGTGYFYVTMRSKRLKTEGIKLELKKYDPVVRKHVMFVEKTKSKTV